MRTWTTRNGSRVTELLHGRCNCFLVQTGTARLLVDTGRTRAWRNDAGQAAIGFTARGRFFCRK